MVIGADTRVMQITVSLRERRVSTAIWEAVPQGDAIAGPCRNAAPSHAHDGRDAAIPDTLCRRRAGTMNFRFAQDFTAAV
jgi:hypothetical protein